MVDCQKCKHCEWDADYAFGSKGGLAFPSACKKEMPAWSDETAEECEEFAEWEPVELYHEDDHDESGLLEEDE